MRSKRRPGSPCPTCELARPAAGARRGAQSVARPVPARFRRTRGPDRAIPVWASRPGTSTSARSRWRRTAARWRAARWLIEFGGFDPCRPYWFALGRTASASRRPSTRRDLRALRDRLREHGWRTPLRDALGRRLRGDLVLDRRSRPPSAEARLQGEDFGDVLAPEGAERFITWLAEPAPLGAYAGINRFLFGVWRDRPDLATAYPELDGPDGLGYAGWAHVYGREELGMPERLLPTLPPHVESARTHERCCG